MELKQSVKEALGYYVYALVDPRDRKIFYIGKGKGNRIFQHSEAALAENTSDLKLDTIRSIISEGEKVGHYIVRHHLEEKEAYLIESALIDMLTYSRFNHSNQLTNLIAGHHQWDEGIMSIEEAIVYVMVKRNGGMTTDQIADAINRQGVHQRKDGQPVTSKQVYATICRFPEMFTKEAGRIMLMI